LRAALEGAPSVEVQPGYHVVNGSQIPGVDMRKLVYFAVSVFWRAAAQRWLIDTKGPTHRLMLGPYEGLLRRFLLADDERLPDDVVTWVHVSPSLEHRHNCVADFPMALKRAHGVTGYRFIVPGITVVLSVGRQMPSLLQDNCASRTGRLIMSAEAGLLKLQPFAQRVQAVPRRGKLQSLR
jgi:hypothetical protein